MTFPDFLEYREKGNKRQPPEPDPPPPPSPSPPNPVLRSRPETTEILPVTPHRQKEEGDQGLDQSEALHPSVLLKVRKGRPRAMMTTLTSIPK